MKTNKIEGQQIRTSYTARELVELAKLLGISVVKTVQLIQMGYNALNITQGKTEQKTP